MRLEISRLSDNFVLPGGRVVHGEFFTHLMYGSEGIASFQFHQTAPDRIVIRVVPGPGSAEARAATVRRCVEEVQALSPGAVHVDVEEMAFIPLSSAGKHRFTRSDVPAQAAGV
jgi:phenylacetate-CoA ligase